MFDYLTSEEKSTLRIVSGTALFFALTTLPIGFIHELWHGIAATFYGGSLEGIRFDTMSLYADLDLPMSFYKTWVPSFVVGVIGGFTDGLLYLSFSTFLKPVKWGALYSFSYAMWEGVWFTSQMYSITTAMLLYSLRFPIAYGMLFVVIVMMMKPVLKWVI